MTASPLTGQITGHEEAIRRGPGRYVAHPMSRKIARTPLRIIGARVLVRRDEGAKMVGKIHIPDQALDKPQTGVVIAVGNEVQQLKAGERIMFLPFAGNEVEHKGETFHLMNEDEILAVIEDE